jgi:hypothetical protein
VPRTPDQIAAVMAICSTCSAYRHGLCLELIREGCGSCKSAADFDLKIAKGIGCKRGLFVATEFEADNTAE